MSVPAGEPRAAAASTAVENRTSLVPTGATVLTGFVARHVRLASDGLVFVEATVGPPGGTSRVVTP